jgi:hypothetical protein
MQICGTISHLVLRGGVVCLRGRLAAVAEQGGGGQQRDW